jgi:hypothetical protein
MDKPFYEFEILENALRFEFLSIGDKIIPKVVAYYSTSVENLYNLVLGDLSENGDFDVHSISNNGDRDKILATVAHTMLIFFNNNPDAFVLFYGSTPSRTRLYQIGIFKELEKATKRFNIQGIKDSKAEPFEKDTNYDAFVISLKK